METRPKLNLELLTTDKLLEVVGWFSLVFLWVLTLTIYSILPEIIPVHFNLSGQPNDYGSKMSILFLPFNRNLADQFGTILTARQLELTSTREAVDRAARLKPSAGDGESLTARIVKFFRLSGN